MSDSGDSLLSVPEGVVVQTRDPPPNFLLKQRGHAVTITSVTSFFIYAGYCLYLTLTQQLVPQCIQQEIPNMTVGVIELDYLICVWGFGVVVLVAAEMLYRIMLFTEELRHIKTRYNGSLFRAFKATFNMRLVLLPLMVVIIWSLIIIVLMVDKEHRKVIASYWEAHRTLLLTQLILNSVVLSMIGLRIPSQVEVSHQSEKNHLDVAHGLAWSYYFGYIKFVVPVIRQRAINWATENKKSRVSPKMYILIPESCYAYTSFTEVDSGITFAGHLKMEMDRAGNIKRSFSQSLYAIKSSSEEEYYCAMEYATPLMSLYEMSNAPEAGLTAEQKDQQVKLFYKTLSYIIGLVRDVRENVVLVPFQDRTEDGTAASISSIMLPLLRHEFGVYQTKEVYI